MSQDGIKTLCDPPFTQTIDNNVYLQSETLYRANDHTVIYSDVLMASTRYMTVGYSSCLEPQAQPVGRLFWGLMTPPLCGPIDIIKKALTPLLGE